MARNDDKASEVSNFGWNGLVRAKTTSNEPRRWGRDDANLTLGVSVSQREYDGEWETYFIDLNFFGEKADKLWELFGPDGLLHGRKVPVSFPVSPLIVQRFVSKYGKYDEPIEVDGEEYDPNEYEIRGPRQKFVMKPNHLFIDLLGSAMNITELDFDTPSYDNDGDGDEDDSRSSKSKRSSGGRSSSRGSSRSSSRRSKRDEDEGEENAEDQNGDEGDDDGDEGEEDSSSRRGSRSTRSSRTTGSRSRGGRAGSRARR